MQKFGFLMTRLRKYSDCIVNEANRKAIRVILYMQFSHDAVHIDWFRRIYILYVPKIYRGYSNVFVKYGFYFIE